MRRLIQFLFWCIAIAGTSQPSRSDAEGWQTAAPDRVRIEAAGPASWRVTSAASGEFTLESQKSLPCRQGETFAVNLSIRVDLNTKALPELACYDAEGREIRGSSALENGPRYFTTNWQELRRVFLVQPGSATVRARVRASGKGQIELADLDFHPQSIDPYRTGALVTQIHPSLRNGVVLESNFGTVNKDAISKLDRDGDGNWALVSVDLDKLTAPAEKGLDWRSNFEVNLNEILWSEGAVLKSDCVHEDREPDRTRALHFKMAGRRGPYRAWMNDPGRAVAVSRDGVNWQRHDAGREVDLGDFPSTDGIIEFWLDNCYRDPVSAGPAYFDYVRLYPTEDPGAAKALFEAARWKAGPLKKGATDERTVNLTVRVPAFAQGNNWPVRCGLPIPQGELATADHVAVRSAEGKTIPSQCRAMARWPDGSVKWVFIDFFHDLAIADSATYTVAYGNRIQPAQPSAGMQIKATDAGLAVDTGAIRFTVPRKRFGMVEDVRLPSGQLLQRAPIAAEITEQNGKVHSALEQPVVHLKVEQAGPLHAVILAETKLAESGKPATGFAHRARIHAYANSPLVEIDYFVANTDSRLGQAVEGSMSSKVPVRSLALAIAPEQPIGRAIHSQSSIEVPGAIVQSSADKVVVHTPTDSRTEQGRALGCVSLQLAENRTLSVGIPAFAEQFPKALRWNREALTIDLWAAEGGNFDWIEGVGKTHHIALHYGTGDAGPVDLLAHTPVLALASPRWYTESRAMGLLSPPATSCLPVVEKTLSRHLNEAVIERNGPRPDPGPPLAARRMVRRHPRRRRNPADPVPDVLAGRAALAIHFASKGITPSQPGGGTRPWRAMNSMRKSFVRSSGGIVCSRLSAVVQSPFSKATSAAS
jgi:hypothetical protein